MLNKRLVLKTVRRIYGWSRNDPVEEELRGWNWDKPPLKPRAYLELGVSEIASKYCETRRDIWLKKQMGIKPETTEYILKGRLVHEAVSLAFREVQKYTSLNINPWDIYEKSKNKWRSIVDVYESREISSFTEKVYKYTLLTLLGEITHEDLVHGHRTPLITVSEYHVDGSNLGLSSNLSIDVLTEGGILIDFKYGTVREFHKLAIAGYALALESEYEIPYDYGILIYFNEVNDRLKTSIKPVYASSYSRRLFIEERDALIDMLIEKREPPRDTKCPQTCPYYKVCYP